jgi:glycosyltransferase involved in cell wall biosynthesis
VKILILYPTVFPDFIGGVEHRNYELAAALARRGHEVTLAAFCGSELDGKEVAPRLRLVSLGPLEGLYNDDGKRSTTQAVRFALRISTLDLSPYDVVESASVPYIHLVPLAFRCRLAGKPLIVSWYEYWGAYWRGYVGRLKAPVYAAIEGLTAQLGDEVTATSRLTEERLREHRARSGVELIPCGIRLAEVQRAARFAENRHGEGPPLVYAGRMLREKRVDLLLEALALVVRRAKGSDLPAGILLTIFGEGPARAEWEGLAVRLGIGSRVDFRGHVPAISDVWAELGRARIAVQPSEREGFGLFPLEAMASGVPVIYCESPESAVPELVRNGVEGIGVPPAPGPLADALWRLLTDDAEWKRLRANAVARAAEYDWDAIATQFEATSLRRVR